MKIEIRNNIEIDNVATHFESEVKKYGTGAYVLIPKKYIGHKAIIIIEEKSPYDLKREAIKKKNGENK